ncbi:hypothetical protein [Pedobacter agri]|uniref:hypothetical protein n=1 Tax=Pedobacter agri TaxID=454586 RepID=UPI00292FA673|nr:hypothetical protein [Pedobacter agri]
MKAENHDLDLVRQKFNDALLETIWSDTGAPSYIIKEGLDPEEYSIMAKQLLEAEQIIAHDFTSEVRDESGSKSAKFDYKSGWFLEGLGEGEVE